MYKPLGYIFTLTLFSLNVFAQDPSQIFSELHRHFDFRKYGMATILKNGFVVEDKRTFEGITGVRPYYIDDPLTIEDGYSCLTGSYFASWFLLEHVSNTQFSIVNVKDELKTSSHFYVEWYPSLNTSLMLDFTPPYLFFMPTQEHRVPVHSKPLSTKIKPEIFTQWPLRNEKYPYRYRRGESYDYLSYAGITKGALEKSLVASNVFEYEIAFAERAIAKDYFTNAAFLDTHPPDYLPTLFRTVKLVVSKSELNNLIFKKSFLSDEEARVYFQMAKQKGWIVSDVFKGVGENADTIFDKASAEQSREAIGRFIFIALYFLARQ